MYYMTKEATSTKVEESKRLATTRVMNGGKSGGSTHPTHLNLSQGDPLDGRMGSIHGS